MIDPTNKTLQNYKHYYKYKKTAKTNTSEGRNDEQTEREPTPVFLL